MNIPIHQQQVDDCMLTSKEAVEATGNGQEAPMENYCVEVSCMLSELIRLVNAKIELGYVPIGGMLISHCAYERDGDSGTEEWFYQAMVLAPKIGILKPE